MEGTIVKGIGGFYYVKIKTDEIYECKARGIFRKNGIVPHVGDWVNISKLEEEGKGVIDEILPRKNVFIRPPIANVDLFIIVTAVAKPTPNLLILDQFLTMAEEKRTEILLCLNKVDLVETEYLAEFQNLYGSIYPICYVSGKTKEGMAELKAALVGKQAAFAGPSGVGKSTLVNCILGAGSMKTGEISQKTHRGKHTTRHCELFDTEGGGMLFDTPGFTSFDVLEVEEDELAYLFAEMEPYTPHCRYDNCRHLKEPGCAVREALEKGIIHESRYHSYKEFIKMIREKRKY